MSFLPALTLVAQGISLVSGIAGTQLEAETSARQDEEKAAVDLFNAKVAEQEAVAEMETAEGDAVDFRRAQSARVAASRAVMAGSGFTLEGSPILVDQAALAEIELGVQRVLHTGRSKAATLRQEGTLLTRRAKTSRINAGLTRKAGTIASIGQAAKGFAGFGDTLSTLGVQFG
ncbi:MAG: hypothetical protein Q8P46_00490 [Hyphomicrobiales bacterium]|nr:hypothetical protein [Hyphomicrobiales bacterium]